MYKIVYTSNSKSWEFESESSDALKHLENLFESGGNDCVSVYDLEKFEEWDGDPNTAPIIDCAMYTIEDGGYFYRCNVERD